MADERLTVPVDIVPGTKEDIFQTAVTNKYKETKVAVKVTPEIDKEAKPPKDLEKELNEKYQGIKLNISIAEENSETIKTFATNLAQAVASKLKAQLEGTPIKLKTTEGEDKQGSSRQPTLIELQNKLNSQLFRFAAYSDETKKLFQPLDNAEKEVYYLLQETANNLKNGHFDLVPKTEAEIQLMLEHIQRINTELSRRQTYVRAITNLERQNSEKSNLSRMSAVYLQQNAKIATNQNLYARWNALSSKAELDGYTSAELKREYSELRKETQRLGLETVSLGDKFKKLFNEHFKTAAVMALINAFRQLSIQAVQDIIAIDGAMTELKKVTDETAQTYEKFLDRAADKAQKLGTTIADTVTATADFARLGYDMSEAEDLATAALVYKNVGDGIEDISVASQSIISTMKAFGIETENAMLIVDKFNKIGNEMPIASKGIGEALTRSAAGLAETNNTLDESIGLIVAANSVIQNPEVVGNALKTLSLRITKTATELEALGEDASYAFETTAEYRNEVLAITGAFGKQIDIMDEATGGYKSTYQILKELSQVWDKIDDQGRQSLLYTLGGARQVNVLSALLNNFSLAEETVTSAADAAGSAMAENEKYLDSITGKINQITASVQELSDTVLSSEFIKFILDITNGFIQATDAVAEFTGAIPLLTSVFMGFLAAHDKYLFNKNVDGKSYFSFFGLRDFIDPANKKAVTDELDAFLVHMQSIFNKNELENAKLPLAQQYVLSGNDFKDALEQYNGLSDANRKLVEAQLSTNASFKANQKAISVYNQSIKELTFAKKAAAVASGLLNSALQMGIGLLISVVINAGIRKFTDWMHTIDNIKTKIDELASELQDVNQELDELLDKQSKNGVTDAENARIAYLKDYIHLLETAEKIEKRRLVEADLYGSDGNPFKKNTYEELRNTYNYMPISDDNGTTQEVLGTKSLYLLYSNLRQAQNWQNEIKDGTNTEYTQSQFDKYSKYTRESYENAISELKTITDIKQQYEAALKLYDKEDDKTIYEFLEGEIATAAQVIEFAEQIYQEAFNSGIVPTDLQYNGDQSEIIYNQAQSWNLVKNYVSETKDGIKSTITEAKNLELILRDVSQIGFDKINEEIDNTRDSLSTIYKAAQEYSSKGVFTLETLQELTQLDQRYLDLLRDENGQIALNEEAIKQLTQARINELRIKAVQQGIDAIKSLTSEAAALEVVESAQADLNESTLALAKSQLKLYATTALNKAQEEGYLETMEQAIEIIWQRTDTLLQGVNALDMYGDAAEDAAKKQQDLLKAQGNAAIKALENRKKPLEDEIDLIDKKKEALQDELDALNEIYEAEDREFELQKLKDAYERAKANKTVRLYTHDKGWQWVADPSEVKEAEDAYHEYLREIEREDAKKAIEDQITALDDAKEAIQDQIEAIDDLKEKFQDTMDNIGKTLEEYQTEMALLAEFEGMTLEQMGAWHDDYAQRVIANFGAMEAAAKSYQVTANGLEADIPAADPSWAMPKPNVEEDDIGRTSRDNTLKIKLDFGGGSRQKPQIYHDGGLVKPQANVSNAFARYIDKLKLGEVPAILQQDEYVLTPNHQRAILDTHKGLINNLNHSKKNISLEIGDIIINNPVGNVSALSDAIIRQLPNQIMKDLYK